MSLTLVFILITVNVIPLLAETAMEPVYVDMLRDRYLSLEKAMWLVIRSGVERNFVLDRIHQTHKTFFNEYFNERGVELLDDDADQKQLLQSFQHIRRMLDTIQTYYGNSNLDEKSLVEYAERGKYVTVSMDRIYNVTEEKDFFRYIRNVRMAIKNDEKIIREYLKNNITNFLEFYKAYQIFVRISWKTRLY